MVVRFTLKRGPTVSGGAAATLAFDGCATKAGRMAYARKTADTAAASIKATNNIFRKEDFTLKIAYSSTCLLVNSFTKTLQQFQSLLNQFLHCGIGLLADKLHDYFVRRCWRETKHGER